MTEVYDATTQTWSNEDIAPYSTAQFRVQIRAGKVGKSFLLFKTSDPGLAFRMDIREDKEKAETSVSLTE